MGAKAAEHKTQFFFWGGGDNIYFFSTCYSKSRWKRIVLAAMGGGVQIWDLAIKSY